MTTLPSGEARAASIPTHGNSRSSDSPTVGSQSQASLLADDTVARRAAGSAEWQDVGQAVSMSGDKDKHEDAAGHSQEPEEAPAQLTFPAPEALQTSMSLENPRWERPVQDARMTRSLEALQYGSLVKEGTPQAAGVLVREQELAPSTPSAEVQSPQNVPTVSIVDANSQLDPRATGTTEAVEETPESPEALHPDSEALPSAESQGVTAGDLVDHSGDLQAQPVPLSPGCSGPHSPAHPMVALRRTSLDHHLYLASEENTYLRSMTSLLNGGEEAISSLTDILVWSEATTGMATTLLAVGHCSVTDLLHRRGPSLRSVSSILGHTRLALSSRLAAGTEWALRSITHMLERVEQRAVEDIHSAVCYLTSYLTPRRTGPNRD